MSKFFSEMFGEMGARRRRMREAFGDRGQGVTEFLVLAGLGIGSLGIWVRPWMLHAASWGLALPFVFVIGFFAIEARRQAQLRAGADADKSRATYDWTVLLWSFGCALLGAAAFALAWNAAPPAPPPENIWTPPQSAVHVDISP